MKTTKTHTLLKLTTTMTLTLALTACGGGGGGSAGTTAATTNTGITNTGADTNNTLPPPPPSLNTLTTCRETNNDKGYASAKDVSNKTLHKLTTDAEVRVWDLSDGSKVACASSGSVEVL